MVSVGGLNMTVVKSNLEKFITKIDQKSALILKLKSERKNKIMTYRHVQDTILKVKFKGDIGTLNRQISLSEKQKEQFERGKRKLEANLKENVDHLSKEEEKENTCQNSQNVENNNNMLKLQPIIESWDTLTEAEDNIDELKGSKVSDGGGVKYLPHIIHDSKSVFGMENPKFIPLLQETSEMSVCTKSKVKRPESFIFKETELEDKKIKSSKYPGSAVLRDPKGINPESILFKYPEQVQDKALEPSKNSIFNKPAPKKLKENHVFKPPAVPKAHKIPKPRQGVLFEKQHILGVHRPNKPRNAVGNFQEAGYKMIRKSGQRGTLVRGRGSDEVKVITKEPMSFLGTGFRDRGRRCTGTVMVTAKHFPREGQVQPVHMDGVLQETEDGRWEDSKGQVYSQLTQEPTQQYLV